MERDNKNFSKWIFPTAAFLFLCLVFFIIRVPLLERIGSNLVIQDEIKPSDAIVVLAGSHTGNRMDEAVRVFNKGMGKVLVFSGYPYYPGMDSHFGMQQYAIKHGIPKEKIAMEKATGERSTWGEALSNLKQLEQLKARSFILVTSSFHTRRSKWVYERSIEKLNMDISFSVQSAPDPTVPYPAWWKARSGQKKIFNEYLKLAYYYIVY
jgi:uncharacterized SAM-binding protein YcdF (DUF218 family)